MAEERQSARAFEPSYGSSNGRGKVDERLPQASSGFEAGAGAGARGSRGADLGPSQSSLFDDDLVEYNIHPADAAAPTSGADGGTVPSPRPSPHHGTGMPTRTTSHVSVGSGNGGAGVLIADDDDGVSVDTLQVEHWSDPHRHSEDITGTLAL
jgi:hypothetical protein